jgi:hypothetical protein
VLVAYLRDGYDNAARLPTEPAAFAASVRARAASLAPHCAVPLRLLMNGTDHHEPQPELPELLRKAAPQGGADDVWLHSTLPAYFAALQRQLGAGRVELPIVRGELRDPSRHHLLPGVLSSRVWIKQRNDTCERELERWAEPFATWAELLCGDDPDARVFTGHLETPRVRAPAGLLDAAWRMLLTCHPHDSICGCSVDAVHEEMRARFDQVEQIAREVTRQSLVALAGKVDTAPLARHGAKQALVVFHPAAVAGAALARATFELGAELEAFELVDVDGRAVPHRLLSSDARELARLEFEPGEVRRLVRGLSDGRVMGLAVEDVAVRPTAREVGVELVLSERGEPNMRAVESGLAALQRALAAPDVERVKVLARFAARVEVEACVPALPPHGYQSLGVRRATGPVPEIRIDDERRIENQRLALEVAPDGTLALTDSRTGLRLQGLLGLCDVADRGDSYNFCPLEGDRPLETPSLPVRVRRERGPCGATLQIEKTLRVPRRLTADRRSRSSDLVELPLRLRVALAPGAARADVEIELDNRAEDHRLSLVFPLGARVREALYDGHFELAHRSTQIAPGRPDWREQPVPEQPLRGFVAARTNADGDGPGLLVAAHGLREGSVSPDGRISLTLLRSFGWLSRDDLANRAGGAGPSLATPGGHCLGPQRFRLALVPFGPSARDLDDAVAEADAFGAEPRGVGTSLHGGTLAGRACLLETAPAGFRPSALCAGAEPGSVIVRGVYTGSEPGTVSVRALVRPDAAESVRLDETPLQPLAIEPDGWIRAPARPNQIVTLRLRYGSKSPRR